MKDSCDEESFLVVAAGALGAFAGGRAAGRGGSFRFGHFVWRWVDGVWFGEFDLGSLVGLETMLEGMVGMGEREEGAYKMVWVGWLVGW